MSSTSTTPQVVPTGMWTTNAVILSILFCFSTAFAKEKPQESWWLTATFAPEQEKYLSLRASEIDPSWTQVSPLSLGTLPKDAASDLGWMKRDGFRFSWEGNLNHNRLVHIGTGVYKADDGSTGRFLLVLEKSASGSWQIKLLHKELGAAGFSVLRVTKQSGIFWGTCMLCSDFRRIIVGKDSFRLQ